jgi:kynurenine formamidase
MPLFPHPADSWLAKARQRAVCKNAPMIRCTLLVTLLAAVLPAQTPRRSAIDRAKLVDLSYAFDDKTIYWPTSPPFAWKKDAWGRSPDGQWYASATFTTSEHGGTHMDSPIHFAEGKWSTAEIPISQLAGPAVVIDITASCARDRNYLLTPADIAAWEKKHGPIREGEIVMIRSGWSRFWPDRKKYMGSDKPGDVAGLSFPGIGVEAAKLLVSRRPAGIGIDTASLDHGPSKNFAAHRVIGAANIYGLENVTNLDRLPEAGATIIALPVKIAGGTGGPVRIIALLP